MERLSCFAPLNEEDREALERACAGTKRRVKAKTDLFREGEKMATANILASGWACRFMTLPDGRRQIAGFLVPGDICRVEVPEIALDYSITALTDCTYLQINPGAMERLAASRPAIGEALAVHEHVATAILRNWILNLGQRNAFERIGHLFCELLVRMKCVGEVVDNRFRFPVTQVELAEATGLTPVHVNRTVQDMRARELVSLQNRELRILDFERLADLVMFDGDYLHPVEAGCEEHA
ncbi:MAG: Crp/Fnr family transcriptional regulator [Sphingobium sp.]|nr:Crp/Fnr family transcriptional regulator [Sphingobium sp.]